MPYCEQCGNKLKDNAKFCTNCGAKVNNSAQSSDNAASESSANMTQAFIANRQKSIQPERSRRSDNAERSNNVKRSGKKRGKAAVAFLMVIVFVVTAFFKPGFLRKKDTPEEDASFMFSDVTGSTQDNNGSSAGSDSYDDSASDEDPYYDLRIIDGDYDITIDDYELTPVAEENLGSDNNIIFGEGVSLAVDPGLLDEDHTGYISKSEGTVSCDFAGVVVPLTIVDCKIDGITSDSMIYINMPLKLEEDEVAGAGYIDEEGVMHPIPHYYDWETGILTIYTTHLSKYCGFPVNNERMSNAMLSYVFADEMVSDEANVDLNQMIEYMEAAQIAGGDLSMGMEIANGLSNGGFVTGNLVGAAGLYEGAVSTVAEGAGNFIFTKGNIGTVGEIMNTNWGKAGTWMPGEHKYGPALKASSINDKFASKYPSAFLEKAGKALNRLNFAVAAFKLANTISNNGWRSEKAAGDATRLAIDTALMIAAESAEIGSYALNIYLIGISLFEYALDSFYTEALEGREQVYFSAYHKYYQNKGTDGGYRSAAEWLKIFKDISNNGGGQKEMEAEIDRYVNEFWVKADEMGPEYLDSIMTDDDRAAFGAAAQGGLNDAMRKKITDAYRSELNDTILNILRVLNMQRRTELLEKYQQEYDNFLMQMNQIVTVRVCTDYSGSKPSKYEGYVVRFKDISGKVDDPQKWQTTLNSEGGGSIRFTFLGHLMANAGTTFEVVKMNGDAEEIIDTVDVHFKTDDSGKYPKLYGVLMLHEEREEEPEEDVAAEHEDYSYETEEDTSSADSERPVHYRYYSDSVNRDEFGNSEVLKALADSFAGSHVDISGGSFTVKGTDSSYHMGKEGMERAIAAAGDTDGALIAFGEDWNVSNVELKGSLSDDYGTSAHINIDHFSADCSGYMEVSASDEYGRDSMESTYSGVLTESNSRYSRGNDSYLALEEIDGRECYVMHIYLIVTPKYTENTHQVRTDTDGETSTYDYSNESYGDYMMEITFVGE